MLGLPFILSRQRNIKASAGLCILMVGMFYVFIYIARYMGPAGFLGSLPARAHLRPGFRPHAGFDQDVKKIRILEF